MIKKNYDTPYGSISYWTNDIVQGRRNLVFLPGLTADHRLFEKQIEFFEDRYNVFVWDAPGHAESRPFELSFTLMDKATWLHEILLKEDLQSPVLIGQSMGGYVSQAFLEKYPTEPSGFVSIDSAPIQRKYVSSFDLWFMKNSEPMYKAYPWKALIRDGANGCAQTEYGRKLMKKMIESYDKAYYCRLAGHGYGILADAIEANLSCEITCPAALICGKKDHAGFTKSYNKRWEKESGLKMHWIDGAGHNSNTDKPDEINTIIECLLSEIN